MDRLFLLDAYALIFRAYYAFIKNPLINSRGENTSAVLGFVNTLEELVRKERPTHVGVAFDPAGGTFRHEAFPQYKAQREATPEAIRFAVPYIRRILEAYRIPVMEVAGFEADDVIGTLARQADEWGIETFMMTPDKDYGQLVTERVRMYRPANGRASQAEVMGPEEVKAKWGIGSTLQVIDLLGLMGDSADNIPGCPGVGEKTAARLIGDFGSVENLLAHTDQLKGALRLKVEANAEQIRTSKWLATIRTDVPGVKLDMDMLAAAPANEEALQSIYEELELRSLLRRRAGTAATAATTTGRKVTVVQGNLFDSPETPAPALTAPSPAAEAVSDLAAYSPQTARYHLVDTPEALARLKERLLQSPLLSMDTETTGTDPIRARLVGMSFAVEEGEAWYVPVGIDGAEALEMRAVYEHAGIAKVGHNLKYDMQVLLNYGIHTCGTLHDTMVAHYLLHPDSRHGMDFLAETCLHYRTIHIEELIGTGRGQKNMADLDAEQVYVYACEDADITLRLHHLFMPQLETMGCMELYRDVEMPLMPVLARMERNGVRLDTAALREASERMTASLHEVENEVYRLAGMEFNVSSPRQVGEVLFGRLQIVQGARKTKNGQYQTGEDVLESLRAKHPVVGKILEYRGLKKLLNTYIDALPLLVNPATNHIHTSFNQAVAATGRLSSSGPNLQNIPVRDALGKEVRRTFVPDEGELFFSADYSQIELRIMAHLSGDEHLIEAFRQGHDIHAATAARIFGKELPDVTSDERRKAKTANFGIIYGISAFGLAERMGVSRTEAKELIDGYFATYPGVKAYMDRSIAMARERGYTETVCGRRLQLPDIASRNAVVRGYAERNAINAPIQGSAADIIKIAMVRIAARMEAEGMRSKMILQVHDELNFSVPPQERDALEQLVVEEMEGAYAMSVPLVADCGWGSNWLEAH